MHRTPRNRRGAAVPEYVLLLAVLLVALVAAAWTFVPAASEGVEALGARIGDRLGTWGQRAAPARAVPSPLPCPYAFDPRTGRWHDPARGYRMVSFAEAASQGC